MAKRSLIISKAAAARILQKAGAERVSEEAAINFAAVLESIGLTISEQAVRISEHSGRKTVNAEDVKLAARS